MFLDEFDCKLDRISLKRCVNLVEIGLWLPQLIGVAEDHQHESVLVRGNADQVLTAMHDKLADGDLLRFGEGIPEHGVTFLSFVAIWQKIVRLLKIAAVDLVPINEPRHVDGVRGFEF